MSNNKVCGTATTNLVSKIQFSNGRTIQYWYDGEERISRVLDSYEGEILYTYDALGQLTSETKNPCPECSDCGTTVNVTYDNYGNILTKGNQTYGYDNVLWKDRLSSFDGQSITYDAQGNPTNYLGHNLTWEKGRQLKSFDNIQYSYNANGIRISKTVDGIRHDYVVDSGRILKETWQDNVLVPIYNNEQEVVGIYYNCTPYYFYKNLQGDVIGISDIDGRAVVAYTYDAWGVCTVLHDHTDFGLANINPYRYRSYYYDTEIGMYYLRSRYYAPDVGRWINLDDATILAFRKTSVRTNLFVYCNNKPVDEEDGSGYAVGDYIHAIGIQIAVNICGIPIGIEFLWSTKTWKPVVFMFAGVSGSVEPKKGYNIINDLIYPMFKNVSKSAGAVMKAISRSNLSISFVGVFGSKKQVFPAGYCGVFTGFSASVKVFWVNIAFSAAIGSNGNGVIGSVGLGVSLTNGFSLAKTYYVQLTGKDAVTNNLTTLFNTIRSKIKTSTDKFRKIAGFIS